MYHSEATAITIDEEITRIVQENYAATSKLVKDNIEALEKVALALLERETIDGAELKELVFGKGTASADAEASTAEGEVSPGSGPCVAEQEAEV